MAAVHLINPLWNYYGGTEREILRLFEELDSLTEVSIWTEDEPDPLILGKYPVRRIVRGTDSFPRGGNLVFGGVFFGVGGWVEAAEAARIIVIVNTVNVERFHRLMAGFARIGRDDVEVVYICEALKEITGGPPGVTHPSPIDLELFQSVSRPERTFTVGRVSRDVKEKYHPDDPALYLRLAEEGVKIRLLGGRCLADQLEHPNIELLPEGAVEVPEFLATLDAFYFRPDPEWFECFGRVVAEAMLTGLPVVVGDRGGYLDYVDHGGTGFVISDPEGAYAALRGLRDDLGLRHRIGSAARASISEMFSPEARLRALEFYAR